MSSHIELTNSIQKIEKANTYLGKPISKDMKTVLDAARNWQHHLERLAMEHSSGEFPIFIGVDMGKEVTASGFLEQIKAVKDA